MNIQTTRLPSSAKMSAVKKADSKPAVDEKTEQSPYETYQELKSSSDRFKATRTFAAVGGTLAVGALAGYLAGGTSGAVNRIAGSVLGAAGGLFAGMAVGGPLSTVPRTPLAQGRVLLSTIGTGVAAGTIAGALGAFGSTSMAIAGGVGSLIVGVNAAEIWESSIDRNLRQQAGL